MSRPLLPNILQNATDPRLQNAPAQPLPPGPFNPAESPSSSGKTYAKRGKITIVACVPCRKRKTKCDGQRPTCSQCVSRNGQCVYDMTDDQRKLTYLRESVDQLQERSNTFEGLLHTVQNASEEEAMEIFRRLRGGNNVQYVAEQVQAGRMLSGVGRQDYTTNSPMNLSSPIQANQSQRIHQYDTLVKTIAESDNNTVNDIIRRLRSREDVSSIFLAAQSGSLVSQPLVTGTTITPPSLETDYSGQDKTFGLVKGTEMRGLNPSGTGSEFNVSHTRQPWTSVTQDEELLEHLLTCYFTWQHSFFQNFPEKLFRKDMANGRMKYCSPTLVNAICAAGCFLSPRKELHTTHEDGRTTVDLFYDEAVRHLQDSSTSTATNTAALYLLSYVEGTRGQLSNLWMFSGRSALMALDINLHLRRDRKNNSGSQEEEEEILNEETARTHAFWGCFHVDQITSFTLGRVPIINVNSVTVPLPESNPPADEELWEAHGLNLPARPGAQTTTFQHCSSLSKIVNSTLSMFFAPNVPLTSSLLLEEYQKYLDWKEQLPQAVASTPDAPPHVLCLHMYYHSAVLLLFRTFLKATIAGSDAVPREICRQAANAISETWSLHHASYGYSGIYMFQVHCLLTACTIHIVNMPSIAASTHFTTACNYLQDLVSRNGWARSSLKVLRGLVEKWSLILPQDVEEALYRGVKSTAMQHIDPALSAMSSSHIWPKGPDPASAHHGGQSSAVPELAASVEVNQGESVAQQQSEQPPMSGAKRPSTRGGPASSPLGGGSQQKRQRLISPQGQQQQASPEGQQDQQQSQQQQETTTRQASGTASEQQAQATAQATTQSAANFLYAPLDAQGQTGPLLAPVHSSTKPPQTVAAAAAGAGAGDHVKQPATSTRKTRKKKDEIQGVQNGVEGLNFGDDWRDPFMGFLGEE